jgi:hypothetical protein
MIMEFWMQPVIQEFATVILLSIVAPILISLLFYWLYKD